MWIRVHRCMNVKQFKNSMHCTDFTDYDNWPLLFLVQFVFFCGDHTR